MARDSEQGRFRFGLECVTRTDLWLIDFCQATIRSFSLAYINSVATRASRLSTGTSIATIPCPSRPIVACRTFLERQFGVSERSVRVGTYGNGPLSITTFEVATTNLGPRKSFVHGLVFVSLKKHSPTLSQPIECRTRSVKQCGKGKSRMRVAVVQGPNPNPNPRYRSQSGGGGRVRAYTCAMAGQFPRLHRS